MAKKSGKKGKKKSGKKSASSKTPTVIDGLSTDEMTKEQLEEHIVHIREEMEREREERNYFQLERDKVSTFWEISKRQLEEKNAELRNLNREMEEAEERHQLELKVYKQKVKHLLYEHQNNVFELKAESTAALRIAQEEASDSQSQLRVDKRNLKINMKESQYAHEESLKLLKIDYESQLLNLRKDFERQLQEIESKNTQRVKKMLDDAELRRKSDLHEAEERKNSQINTLIKNHEKAFADIKNYYNDITLNNLALINTLKEQIEEMKVKEERLERLSNELTTENKKILEPLNKAKEENIELKKTMVNYEKDKLALKQTKALLLEAKNRLKKLTWEHEVLLERFQSTEKERDDLYNKYVSSIMKVQQKSGLKNILLERKLHSLIGTVEKKEAQLNEVLSASNLDPSALAMVTQKLEDILDSKNDSIKDLQYELARVCKAHNDLLQTYETKLQQHGIPIQELGFTPLESMMIANKKLGKGPAGLVSAPP